MKYLIILVCLFMVSCVDKDRCTEKMVELFPEAKVSVLSDAKGNTSTNYYLVNGDAYACFEGFQPVIEKLKVEEVQKGKE